MAISGPQALKSLDNATRDIRNEEKRIAKLLARSTERMAKLSETKASLIRQLAKIRLDKTAYLEMQGHLSNTQEKAHKVLENHDVKLLKAEKQLKILDDKISQNARARQSLLTQIDGFQAELKALSSKIASEINNDPKYLALKNETKKLQEIALFSLEKAQQAENNQKQKGRPYRDDPLFMYLWEAQYGTKNYKSGNLTRFFDSMIAKMIGYYNAKPNFTMLNEIPLRLNEHAKHQSSLAQESEDKLDKLEEKAVDAAGGKPARLALLDAQQKQAKIDQQMQNNEDERDELAHSYQLLAQGREPAFEKAAKILSNNLKRQDISQLLVQAKLTSSNEDNIIITKIDDIETRIGEEKFENSDHKSRLKTLSKRRRELEDIEWEFKKSRFDDPRSTFRENSLTKDLLSEFLKGTISAAVYWQHWQGSQSWRAGTSDWGGGIGLPRAGRRSNRGNSSPWSNSRSSKSSTDFSRPRRSSTRAPSSRRGSSGSRKGGGFKTGGGF